MFRVGIGYDVHAFARSRPDRPLILGGVKMEGAPGLEGHSDADVLIHSICDAVLGALGLGDLGRHFPDSDPSLEGVSSLVLLEKVGSMMTGQGYRLINIDAVVIAQTPKIASRTDEMKKLIAGALGATEAEVNIKGTSPEKLGALGRTEGIAAESIALIGKI